MKHHKILMRRKESVSLLLLLCVCVGHMVRGEVHAPFALSLAKFLHVVDSLCRLQQIESQKRKLDQWQELHSSCGQPSPGKKRHNRSRSRSASVDENTTPASKASDNNGKQNKRTTAATKKPDQNCVEKPARKTANKRQRPSDEGNKENVGHLQRRVMPRRKVKQEAPPTPRRQARVRRALNRLR